MSTQISAVYDALETLIEGQLTTYSKLPNPYDAEDNAEMLMRKGYGIAFAGGINTERLVGCKISLSRTLEVVLVNQITVTDHDTTGHATLEKNLLEDFFKVVRALENDSDLGGAATKAHYVADGGVEFLEGDRAKFLILAFELGCEYFEELT